MKILLVTIMLVVCSVLAHADDKRIVLYDFSAHLFLVQSGTFSEDVTKLESFSTWNLRTISNEIQGGKFESFLLKIHLASGGETFRKGEQVSIEISEKFTGKILEKFSISDIYIGSEGTTYKPLFVSGYDCVPINITVKTKEESITKPIQFQCGE